jgi:competence protein ComEA
VSARSRSLVAAAALLAAFPALAAKRALSQGERIDLNRASVSELMRLPGVGEKRAQAIVAQRQKQPFRRIEDVISVKGLGRAWFQKARPNLVAGSPSGSPASAAPKK